MNKFIPFPVMLCLVTLALSIYFMFQVKYQVRTLIGDTKELEKQIIQERESIRVLGAELAYLNQPERLKFIAEKYLPHYTTIKLSQIARINNKKAVKQNSVDEIMIGETDVNIPQIEFQNVSNVKMVKLQGEESY